SHRTDTASAPGERWSPAPAGPQTAHGLGVAPPTPTPWPRQPIVPHIRPSRLTPGHIVGVSPGGATVPLPSDKPPYPVHHQQGIHRHRQLPGVIPLHCDRFPVLIPVTHHQ